MIIETIKCKDCRKIFPKDLVKIKDEWAYCPLCNQPLFDITIQEKDHWIFNYPKAKKYLNVKEKSKMVINYEKIKVKTLDK